MCARAPGSIIPPRVAGAKSPAGQVPTRVRCSASSGALRWPLGLGCAWLSKHSSIMPPPNRPRSLDQHNNTGLGWAGGPGRGAAIMAQQEQDQQQEQEPAAPAAAAASQAYIKAVSSPPLSVQVLPSLEVKDGKSSVPPLCVSSLCLSLSLA